MRNTFGNIFRLTDFGESHGAAIGGVIDGVPSGFPLDVEKVRQALNRRRPGQSAVTTSRREPDEVEFLSGIYEGKTLGTPIGFIIRNTNQRSGDYEQLSQCWRPSHADYTYDAKYGFRDPRGGGRASARETACRVVAGAVAQQLLQTLGVEIKAYTSQIGTVKVADGYRTLDLNAIEENAVRCPDEAKAAEMIAAIEQAKADGDTLGGIVTCVARGVAAGWGEPVFGRLDADLASAMMGINAAKGVEIGDGFTMAGARGSEMLDTFVMLDDKVRTLSNHSGGIQGGISNGEDIVVRVAFKPVATLMRDVPTIDRKGNNVVLRPKGRHDVCVVPRAVPVVEAMAAMVLIDHYLMNHTARFQ